MGQSGNHGRSVAGLPQPVHRRGVSCSTRLMPARIGNPALKLLFLLNDPPDGTERSYNGLRLACELLKDKDAGHEVHVFLTGDAAACAKGGQNVAQGYYHIESFLNMRVTRDTKMGVCGTCMDARRFTDSKPVTGAHRSNMAELAEWTT